MPRDLLSHLLHSPKPYARKPSTAPATRRAQAQASEAQARSTRQIVLGYSSWLLVSMEGRTRARPARDRGSVAPGRLQTVLDHALQSEKTSRWWSENFQADTRADLPDGHGESHLGVRRVSMANFSCWTSKYPKSLCPAG